MGRGKKKNVKHGLGAALVKGQRKTKAQLREQRREGAIAELGFESASGTTKSVTETNNLEAFIAEAVMAGRKFEAQRETRLIEVQNQDDDVGRNVTTMTQDIDDLPIFDFKSLPIPRRPPWTHEMSAAELDRNEKESFLKWRRAIAMLEARNKGLHVSPFEKNLDFWRQLWRVVERSDLVVQVVDARNPLLFRCADVENFTKETASHKTNLLVVNKSDFLTQELRQSWKQYFDKQGIKFVFFSARAEQLELDKGTDSGMNDADQASQALEILEHSSSEIVSRKQLLYILEKLAKEAAAKDTNPKRKELDPSKAKPCVGMVGYPNVGKSSVINVLFGVTSKDHTSARVSVAATPGHTKHFQTLHLSNNTILCDCPGLVFPTFMSTKADLLCNGILPIDEIRGRDFFPAIEVLSKCLKREVFESTYVLQFPLAPTVTVVPAGLLIETFCEKKGLHGSGHGRYNEALGARFLLKDFVTGKLCYCVPPPSENSGAGTVEQAFQEISESDELTLADQTDLGEAVEEGQDGEEEDELFLAPSTTVVEPAEIGEITEEDLALLMDADQLLYTETQKIDESLDQSKKKKKRQGKGRKGRQADPYGNGDYFEAKAKGKNGGAFTRVVRPWEPSAKHNTL